MAWYFLYDKIQQEADFWADLKAALFALYFWHVVGSLLVVSLLMWLNWSLESLKWQLLLRPITPISFWVALAQVLRGLATTLSIPTQLGVFAGRTWSLSPKQRMQSIGALLLGSHAQSYLTFGIGGFSVLFFLSEKIPFYFWIGISVVILLLHGLAWLYFGAHKKLLFALRKYPKIYHAISIIRHYSHRERLYLLLYAAGRYLIFCSQFLILLWLFNIKIDVFDAFIGISLVFAVKSLLPTFHVLSDLGLRESAAVFFFTYYDTPQAPLVLASLLLWAMNILIPSVIGLLYWAFMPNPQDRVHKQNS